MKIALKSEVIATWVLTEPVTAKLYPYDFEIYQDKDKIWLKVTKPVKDYDEYLPKVFMKNGQVHLEIGKDDIFNDLLDWLQYIEVMGAFNIQIEHVYWDRPSFCWIAETDEEHRKVPLTEYARIPNNGRQQMRLKSSNLSNIVIYRRQLEYLHIPFTYFKEGQRFFNNFNYYFAFINFFMMLEYCFADGKFKVAEVMKKFKESKLLQMCILEFLTMNLAQANNVTTEALKKECRRRNKEFDVDGLICLFVMLRGELSHASTKSESRYRDDNELRPFVVAISCICFLLCGHLQIYGFTSEKSKLEMIDKNIAKYSAMLERNKIV